MRRLNAIFIVALTSLLVATGAQASVVESGGSMGATAGAKVMPSDGQAGRAKVLVIGDSVFTAFNHVASARELLDSQQKTIFAAQNTSF